MEYLIILIVFIFLFGSVSLFIPSKRTRKLAKLRLDAAKLGFKIASILHSNIPYKSDDIKLVSYQLRNNTNIKEGHFIRDKKEFILYSPQKLKYSDEYEALIVDIKSLPESIIEIIFSKAVIAFLWNEDLGIEELKNIKSNLKKL